MADGPQVMIPAELLRQLQPLAAQMGIADDLPGVTRIAPTLDVSMPIRLLSLELGQLLSRQLLFLRGEDVVTVDSKSGKVSPMTAKMFTGYVEEFVAIKVPGRSQRARDSLNREEADQILSQKIFKDCLRPLRAVHTMRLPVLREDGRIELLEPGYDAASEIYTVDALEYALDWTKEQALEWLEAHGQEYPWSWPDDGPRELRLNRSWAVHVTAMLGMYCRAMFQPGTPKPMVVYVGNQAGTGKSTLAAMNMMPTFGHAATVDSPSTDENMVKVLETCARTRQPYVFFDDVRYGLDSSPLNRFILSSTHTGRIYGDNASMFHELNVSQVFATGNGIKLTPDLARRALVVNLFLACEVRGRKFAIDITPEYLAKEEIRSKFLSALWALVRNYIDQVAAMVADGFTAADLRHQNPLPSFGTWSGLMAQMVVAAGMADPLSEPELSPDEAGDDMRALLVHAASEAEAACTFTRHELVEIARRHGLLESLVGVEGDGELDSKSNKRWGRQLQAWRGRELVDAKGRRFRFAHKKIKSGITYPLVFL